MPWPNFFVIGAQKCGTDALYLALRQHPEIFMSPAKEPFYFITDGGPPRYRMPNSGYARRLISDPHQYLALFQGAGGCRAIGEASAIYLSSYEPERTAERIHRMVPGARLIALLRQPADRAYSAFQYYRAHELEPLDDFEAALADEPARIARGDCPDIRHRQNGRYHLHLKPYLERFPREQVRIYLHDEWSAGPDRVLRDIFEFLGVDPEFRPTVVRANVTTRYRSQYVRRLLNDPSLSQLVLRRLLPRAAKTRLRHWNESAPTPFPAALRARLTREYHDDILALQSLIARDLSHWLDEGASAATSPDLPR